MAYQRAEFHTGFTYQQTCETCRTVFQYTDYSLDFRPWYPDGYVDCPKCKSHMRHNERFAIDAPNSSVVVPVAQATEETGNAPFCANCGAKFTDNARFCAMCGAKRATI